MRLVNFKISLTLMYLLLGLTIIFKENVEANISVIISNVGIIIGSVVSIGIKEVEVKEVNVKEFKGRVKIKDSNNFW